MTHRAVRFTDGNSTEPDAPVWSGWYRSDNMSGIDVIVTFGTFIDIALYDLSVVDQAMAANVGMSLIRDGKRVLIVDCCFREVECDGASIR